jgi:hypothetical protein
MDAWIRRSGPWLPARRLTAFGAAEPRALGYCPATPPPGDMLGTARRLAHAFGRRIHADLRHDLLSLYTPRARPLALGGAEREALAVKVLGAPAARNDEPVLAHGEGIELGLGPVLIGRVAGIEPVTASSRTEATALVAVGALVEIRPTARETFGRSIGSRPPLTIRKDLSGNSGGGAHVLTALRTSRLTARRITADSVSPSSRAIARAASMSGSGMRTG